MGPANFDYAQSDWTLTLNSTDENNYINFENATSAPLNWFITPDLPSFLTLLLDGVNAGAISQVKGVVPTVMDEQTYIVTASLKILDQTFQKTATVSITVTDITSNQSTPPTASTR